jgi:hypothetical protein
MYVPRPNDTFQIRIESAKNNFLNFVKDWAPPKIYRGLKKLEKVIKG